MRILRRFILSGIVITCFACSQTKPENAGELSSDSLAKPENTEGRASLDCDSLKRSALKMDSVLMQENEIVYSTASAGIKAFTGFAFHCASDSLSPVFLIKTAQVARVINQVPQAKIALERCIAAYPAFRDRPAALFLLAQLYDETTYLNNEQEAKKLYQSILDEYPNSDWAKSAAAAILLLGKSDEQIIQEFKKKNARS